jgi:hypothetical protein
MIDGRSHGYRINKFLRFLLAIPQDFPGDRGLALQPQFSEKLKLPWGRDYSSVADWAKLETRKTSGARWASGARSAIQPELSSHLKGC